MSSCCFSFCFTLFLCGASFVSLNWISLFYVIVSSLSCNKIEPNYVFCILFDESRGDPFVKSFVCLLVWIISSSITLIFISWPLFHRFIVVKLLDIDARLLIFYDILMGRSTKTTMCIPILVILKLVHFPITLPFNLALRRVIRKFPKLESYFKSIWQDFSILCFIYNITIFSVKILRLGNF